VLSFLNANPELKDTKGIFLISSRKPDLGEMSDLMTYVEENIDDVKPDKRERFAQLTQFTDQPYIIFTQDVVKKDEEKIVIKYFHLTYIIFFFKFGRCITRQITESYLIICRMFI
jgi:3-hydroxy-3-methylglutaryl CoA synthase